MTNNNMLNSKYTNMIIVYNSNKKPDNLRYKFDYKYYINYIINIYNFNKEICNKCMTNIIIVAILLNYIDLLYILSYIFFIGITYVSLFNIYYIVNYINTNNISGSDFQLCFIDKIPMDILNNMIKDLLLLCIHWTIYSSIIICISIFTYVKYIFDGLITSLIIQILKLYICMCYSKIYITYFNLYETNITNITNITNKTNNYNIDCPIIFNKYLSKLIINNIFSYHNMCLLVPLKILNIINNSYELDKLFRNINIFQLLSFGNYIYNIVKSIKNIFV